MWKNLRSSALLLAGAALLLGCQDRQMTAPEGSTEGDRLARVLQPGQFEHPCGATMPLTLRNAAGAQIGQVAVWNGPTTAYVRITAQRAWELAEVRVGGARHPEHFPRTGGVVDPSRFQYGGLVSPTQVEVVIEALHLGNPFDVLPGDEVLLAVFARLRPVAGGESVSAWAEGTPFQPGQHPMYFQYALRECAPPPPATATISAGMDHTCGLTASGAAYCWGWNAHGQLGDGTTTDRSIPTPVAGGLHFASISAVWGHTCGLTPEGAAYCWGRNGLGQLGDGTTIDRHTPTPVAGGLRFTTIAGRMGTHSCGLTPEGVAYCWGFNGWGQLGDGTTINRHVPTSVAGGLRFTTISAVNHTCGITVEGAAYCWGWNNGRLGDGTTTDRHVPTAVVGGHLFAGISAGLTHTCALTSGGDAFCWGANTSGALGDGTTIPRLIPVAVTGGLRFTSISAGGGQSCGIIPDTDVYCWGRNEYGQLGDGTTTERLVPTAIAGGLSFASIAAGALHTCGLTTIDDAYCWGQNFRGKLGDGTYTNRHTPTPVFGWGALTALPFVGDRQGAVAGTSALHAAGAARSLTATQGPIYSGVFRSPPDR